MSPRSSRVSGRPGSKDATSRVPTVRPSESRTGQAITDARASAIQSSAPASGPARSSSRRSDGAASQSSTRGRNSGRPRSRAASVNPGLDGA